MSVLMAAAVAVSYFQVTVRKVARLVVEMAVAVLQIKVTMDTRPVVQAVVAEAAP